MKLEEIDTSTTAGKARVMQLAAEGRGLAYKNRHNKIWERHSLPESCDWDWRSASFAIIADPVGPDEVWLALLPDGKIKGVCETEEEAGYFGLNSVRYIRADLAGGDA